MAVSKRLRYEVLRRDNHTCHYCGRSAPEVRLTVDHVLPVALGGRDEPTNLVACCSDCNSGKTSTTPDGPLVANVEEHALRWAAAVHAAAAKALGDYQAAAQYRDGFGIAWDAWKIGTGPSAKGVPLDENWQRSIDTFRARGLPLEILIEAVDKTMRAHHVKPGHAFRYLCGIAWKEIGRIEDAARALLGDAPEETAIPSLDERVDAAVIEAAVLVWKAWWCQAHEADPPEGFEDRVREDIAEVYPEEASPSQLMAAAETAAEVESTALSDFVGDEEEPPFAYRLKRTYCAAWAKGDDEAAAPLTVETWSALIRHAVSAQWAGYGEADILQGAHHAGLAHSGDLRPFLNTVDQIESGVMSGRLPHDYWLELVDKLALSQDQIDESLAAAREAQAARRQRVAARAAAGEPENPWDF
jgi:hypothetical protein